MPTQRHVMQCLAVPCLLCCDVWPGAPPAAQVSPEQRERAKRVVYGIIYGLTSYGLSQQLADRTSPSAAQAMIDGFLSRFPGGSSCIAPLGLHARF